MKNVLAIQKLDVPTFILMEVAGFEILDPIAIAQDFKDDEFARMVLLNPHPAGVPRIADISSVPALERVSDTGTGKHECGGKSEKLVHITTYRLPRACHCGQTSSQPSETSSLPRNADTA